MSHVTSMDFFFPLVWVQTACKGYQQTTKDATSREIVGIITIIFYRQALILHHMTFYGSLVFITGSLPRENLALLFAIIKYADQYAHPQSLFSAFVNRFLEIIFHLLNA